MGKFIYLFKNAETKGKVTGIIALVLVAVAILMVGISAYSAINGPITEFYIFKVFIPNGELGEFNDMIDEMVVDLEEVMAEADEETLDQFEDEHGVSVEECIELIEVPSLNNLVKLFTIFEKDEDMVEAMDLAIKIITVYALVLGTFLLLATYFMRGGFAITSMILSPLYFLLFSGVVWLGVYAAVCIAFSVVSKMFRKAYNDYKVIEKYKASQANNAVNP